MSRCEDDKYLHLSASFVPRPSVEPGTSFPLLSVGQVAAQFAGQRARFTRASRRPHFACSVPPHHARPVATILPAGYPLQMGHRRNRKRDRKTHSTLRRGAPANPPATSPTGRGLAPDPDFHRLPAFTESRLEPLTKVCGGCREFVEDQEGGTRHLPASRERGTFRRGPIRRPASSLSRSAPRVVRGAPVSPTPVGCRESRQDVTFGRNPNIWGSSPTLLQYLDRPLTRPSCGDYCSESCSGINA